MQPVRYPTIHCRAGVARRDITPPVGIHNRNWGAALHETAAGVHRPFTTTALCLGSLDDLDAVPFTLLAVDLGWLGEAENEEFLGAARAAGGLPPERLLLMLCHTHAGPNLYTTRTDQPGGHLLRPYFERVIQQSIAAMTEARAAMREAWITFGAGRCALAANRDTWDEAAQEWVCGFNPSGAADDTLVVARVTGAAGEPLATLINYGCHPTTLGPENRLLSPDYIGAMRETLEARDGALTLFSLGACGETGPRDGFTGDPAVADRNGRALGHAAAATLEMLPPPGSEMAYAGPLLSGATLGIWRYQPLVPEAEVATRALDGVILTLDLPLKPKTPLVELEARYAEAAREVATAQANGDVEAERRATARLERARRRIIGTQALPDGDCLPTPIWLWRLGQVFVVAVPGEPYSLLQTELRRRFPDRTIVVSAVTNGGVSYLLPRDRYGTGLYQDWVSFIDAGALETIIEAAASQIGAWIAAAR